MKLGYTIALLLFSSSLIAQFNIAIIDFSGKNVSSNDASALTDRLRTELFLTGKFQVVEREKMLDILKEQSFQMSGCTSDACAIEVGQLIGVEQIIAGSISNVGRVFSISARVISVEKGKVVKTATYDCDGPIGDLLKFGMKDIAQQLAGLKTAQQSGTSALQSPVTKEPISPQYYTTFKYNNPFNIHKKIGGYGLLTSWGLTVFGALAVNDQTIATTMIPIVGPFVSIWVVEKRDDLYFIEDGKELLTTAGKVQSGFALYYLLSAIGYELWNPPKRISVSTINNFSGLCRYSL